MHLGAMATIENTTTGWKPVTSGVPQGSVLGLSLFVIYINDLPNVIQSDAYLFVDDTKIFRRINKDTAISHLQDGLHSMSN